MTAEIDRLQTLASRLPTFLYGNIEETVEEARGQYRTLITLAWITTLITVICAGSLIYLVYRYFRPLAEADRRLAANRDR